MSKYGVIKNGSIKVAGVDLSNHCLGFEPTYGAGALPGAAMGDVQDYSLPGTGVTGLRARFLNDFAAGSVFAVLNPLKYGAPHVIEYRNDAGSPSALNPTYSGLFFITAVTGLVGGNRGANSEVDCTWAINATLQEKTTV